MEDDNEELPIATLLCDIAYKKTETVKIVDDTYNIVLKQRDFKALK